MPPKIELEKARLKLVAVEATARELALELGRSGGDPATIDFLMDLRAAYERELKGWPMLDSVLQCRRAQTVYDQYKDALVTLV